MSGNSRSACAGSVSLLRILAVVVFCVSAVVVMVGCGGGGGGVTTVGYGNLEGWVCYDSSAKAGTRGAGDAPSLGVMRVSGGTPRGSWLALEGATVTIGTKSDVTDSAGYFYISSIREGTYTVTISHPRFMPVTLQATIYRDQTTGLGSQVAGAFYYILVGINDYRLWPSTPSLSYCVADAVGIYNKLTNDTGSHNWLKGYTPTLLTDSAATWNAIRSAFVALQSAMRPQDHLVFYFSGHGGQIDDTAPLDEADNLDEVICVYDVNYILDDELASWAADLAGAVGLPPENLVFVFDSCRSGGMATIRVKSRNGAARTSGEVVVKFGKGMGQMAKDLSAHGYTVMAACRDSENSYETSDYGHGYFTYFFLDGLAWTTAGGGHLKADVSPYDDLITASELYEYTDAKLGAAGVPQTPVLEPIGCPTPLFGLVR